MVTSGSGKGDGGLPRQSDLEVIRATRQIEVVRSVRVLEVLDDRIGGRGAHRRDVDRGGVRTEVDDTHLGVSQLGRGLIFEDLGL